MATPRILLLSRKAAEEQLPQLQELLNVVPVSMAIAQSDADKDAALKLTPTVATFNQVTAIVYCRQR
jgi:predicted class III extradiol MEMO1 family dioxygenase